MPAAAMAWHNTVRRLGGLWIIWTSQKKERPAGRSLSMRTRSSRAQAAFSHIAVSNALLISGMFMPKLGLTEFFALFAAGLAASLWATSVARSHDPFSWERATEKSRNT
jgi:hypothetical protein